MKNTLLLKRFFSIAFIIVLVVTSALLPVSVSAFEELVPASGDKPITAAGGMAIDLDTKTVLYTKSINVQCRPASLTKMMTLLVAFEKTEGRHEELISLTKEMIEVPAGSSSAYLQAGDVISLHDLFYAMMLPSGNDAAKALAYIVAGGEKEFANLMNEKAQELGMVNSHFKNAHGFDEDGHYTTTRDLLLLAMALCENPKLVEIFSTYKYTATIYDSVNKENPSNVTYYNSNDMINPSSQAYTNGFKGIKTGFTKLAGNCLASYYEKNDRRIVIVATNAVQGEIFNDTKTIWSQCMMFDTLDLEKVFSQKKIVVDLENADSADEFNGQLELRLEKNEDAGFLTVSSEVGTKIRIFEENTVLIKYPVVKAPVRAGEYVGDIEFLYNNEVIYKTRALASRTVDAAIESPADLVSLGIKGKAKVSFGFLLSPYFLVPVISLTVIALGIYLYVNLRKRQAMRIRARQRNLEGRRRRRSSRPGNRTML